MTRMACNLNWETCNCKDCQRARELYEELMYYHDDRTEFKWEIEEIERELKENGYPTL